MPGLALSDLISPNPHDGTLRRDRRLAAIALRRSRTVTLGDSFRVQFENVATVRDHLREILRAERTTDPREIECELSTYAHLLPNGSEWKATLLIELPDADERALFLPALSAAAHRIYIDVAQHPRVFAQANEDLPDRHLSRPSAVHFLRFALSETMRAEVLAGASVKLGCTHEAYRVQCVIAASALDQLRADLVPPRSAVSAAPAETSFVTC